MSCDLLIDGGVLSKTTEFALDGDARGVEWSGLNRVEGRSALRVCIVMIVMEVACAMVKPATGRINQSGRVQRVYKVGQFKLGIFSVVDLAPAFIVDDPSNDAGVASVLADKHFELALELLLLFGIGKNVDYRAVFESLSLGWSEGWHILDEHEPQLITGLVEQGWFDFDLDVKSVKIGIETLVLNR